MAIIFFTPPRPCEFAQKPAEQLESPEAGQADPRERSFFKVGAI